MPPLSNNSLLFLLIIIISAGAFRDYSSINVVVEKGVWHVVRRHVTTCI